MNLKRPWYLTGMAVILAAVALSFPLQIMWLYGHGLNELDDVFAKMTLLNWFVAAGCLYCAYLALEASPLLPKALPALTLLVALNNGIVGYYAVDYAPWMAHVGTAFFTLLNFPLLHSAARELMRHPERRRWLRAKRYPHAVPVVITGALRGRSPLRAATFDVSDSGLFLPVAPSHFEIDDCISVRLTFGSFSQIRCEGRVVRRAEDPRGVYPAGIGIQFTGLNRHQRRELRRQLERALPTH